MTAPDHAAVERALARGDLLADNDPRMPGRKLVVLRVSNGIATCREYCGKREFHIRLDRIHLDGKPRRSGFTRTTP